jgi:hypothetical protein
MGLKWGWYHVNIVDIFPESNLNGSCFHCLEPSHCRSKQLQVWGCITSPFITSFTMFWTILGISYWSGASALFWEVISLQEKSCDFVLIDTWMGIKCRVFVIQKPENRQLYLIELHTALKKHLKELTSYLSKCILIYFGKADLCDLHDACIYEHRTSLN